MKRTVYDGTEILKIKECDKPSPGPGEVLIKVESATICGTDIHIMEGNQPAEKGVTLGHEFAGYVEEIGEGVHACKTGDLVTVEPHVFCGTCKFCRIGKVQECLHKLAFGVHLNGGFQEYAVVPQTTVYPVPEGISADEAALCEALGCCLHGIEQVGVNAGDKVLIMGGGVIGIMLGKFAKLMGASCVMVSEPMEHRRRIVLDRCADYAVDPTTENLEKAVMKYTDGLGADVVIEAAGRLETARQAVDLAGRCGRILYFGIVPPGKTVDISPNKIFKNELTIVGSAINPFVHHRVLQLLKVLDTQGLITHWYPIGQINEAIMMAKKSVGLKICIKPHMKG